MRIFGQIIFGIICFISAIIMMEHTPYISIALTFLGLHHSTSYPLELFLNEKDVFLDSLDTFFVLCGCIFLLIQIFIILGHVIFIVGVFIALIFFIGELLK